MSWAAIIPGAIAAASSLIGGHLDRKQSQENSEANIAMQREFAQQGIRWRVADAKAAGIHPLYALGASGASFSPSVNVGSMGPALASAGQDIGRAFAATASQREREGVVQYQRSREAAADRMAIERHNVQLEGLSLENELRRLQIRRELSQVGPPFPSAVSGSGGASSFPVRQGEVESRPLKGLVEIKRSEQVSRDPNVAGREAAIGGGKPAFVPYRVGGNRHGFTLDVPSSEFGEGLEGGGPAAWLLGALGVGGHYGARAMEWIEDEMRAFMKRNPKGSYPAVHPRARR